MSICIFHGPAARPLGLALAYVLFSFGAFASETDNFYLPLEPEFADLGDYLEAVHTRAIEEGVRQVNSRIERALNLKDAAIRARELEHCHAPDALAEAVAGQFGDAPTESTKIEHPFHSAWARQAFPNKIVIHEDTSMNFRGHFLLDPRAYVMLVQAGTIKAFGVYFGTDKLVHLHQLGIGYYRHYRMLLREGASPEDADRKVIKHFAKDAFLAEGNFFGTIGTGIYSNGDMAANYAGFKFFLNLTEKVVFLGREHEPLAVRCGVFWRVNDHVRPQSGWMRPFVTDHWNEALNPSLYDSTMRSRIHEILQSRADRIVEFYTRRDGRTNDPASFENLAHTLATYAGEPYGHSGRFEKLMHIGNTCLPALKERETSPASK